MNVYSLHLRATLLALAVAMPCGACVPWPAPGSGGAAERHGTESSDALVLEARYWHLRTSGGELWSPAKMQQAHELLVRARREYAGQLIADAVASRGAAETLLEWIEKDLVRRARRSGS